MGDHDMASVVGQMLGLDDSQERPEMVTPATLVRRFCGPEIARLRADAGTTTKDGVATSRGWCGYIGGRGDSMATGFDEGYDWMGYLGERGWRGLAAKGDWPFVIYLLWSHKGEKPAIAEYIEGDLTVWEFDTPELMKHHYAELRDCP